MKHTEYSRCVFIHSFKLVLKHISKAEYEDEQDFFPT